MTDRKQFFEDVKDIPGTTVFTSDQARKGYWLNQFSMSLMKPENRKIWLADEEKYLEGWSMTEEQKKAVLARDYNKMLELGGNIYYLAKIFSTDGFSFVQAVSTMTGMSIDEYKDMMMDGGRPVDGNRSKKEGN